MTALAPPSIPAHPSRTTTELYRACMNLSEEARALLVQNEGMKRLGLNAQVLATQTGEQGRALEVIVSDIGRLSHAIRDVLEALGDTAKLLSNSSIEVLRLSHMNASYAQGFARGIDPRSDGLYKATHSLIRSRVRQHRVDLLKRLRAVSSLVEELGRVVRQLSPLTTMIRIVVSEVKSKAAEMLGTVDDLNAFRGHLEAKVEHMGRIHNICIRYIQDMDQEDR